MDKEENKLRDPDLVKRERLIDDAFDFEEEELLFHDHHLDDDLEKALKESQNLFQEKIELSENYQKQIIETYMEETRKRKQRFTELLLHLKKVAFYDPEVKEIYEILDPIIDSYISQCIETVELDPVTYDRIFYVIRSLKTCGVEVLRTLLLRES